ncbi:MAG: enoyl-CoA hydratase/isomerase family protein [Xanthobacteraceae bacterium]
MPIRYEKDGAVATFIIDNGKVNPTNPAMHKELFEYLQDFERDRDLKVGILRGAGDRAFCAGDDIKTPRRRLETEENVMRHFFHHDAEDEFNYPGWEREVLALHRMKPIIAAVNGWCLGQGMVYLLQLSDMRISGDDAKYGFPEIAYGIGGAGGLSRIYRHLPRAVALKMLLTGDPIDAQEALRLNLVNEVVPKDQVMTRARELADRIAGHNLIAIRTEMESYNRTEFMDRENSNAMAEHLYRLQILALRTEDFPIDFKSKRPSSY